MYVHGLQAESHLSCQAGCRVQMKSKGSRVIGRLKNNLTETYAHINTDLHLNWHVHTRQTGAHTNTDNHRTHIQRKQRLSQLVAVLPPPGTINVSSHLVTTWPSALAEDGWRSMGGERERDCVLGLKLAMIPPQGFARTCRVRANTHVCTQQEHTRSDTHIHSFLLSSLPPSICWHVLFISNDYFCRWCRQWFFPAVYGDNRKSRAYKTRPNPLKICLLSMN